MIIIDWEILLRLFLAMVFGGLIGLEREIGNRPAGFRTHTLVCMGSALVMLTSDFIFNTYSHVVLTDPGRLGAQVISGIGFLGAGTILKDGSRVRGLTTAASLWVVACIGLAIGSGFYWGALAGTLFAYITLVLLKKFEGQFMPGIRNYDLHLDILNSPGQIAKITGTLGALSVKVRDINVTPGDGEYTQVYFRIFIPTGLDKGTLLGEISRIPGVKLIDDDTIKLS